METDIIDTSYNQLIVGYRNRVLGEVIMSGMLFTMLSEGKYNDIYHIIVGILRQNFDETKIPFELTTEFLESDYKNYLYPNDFNEKTNHYLKYLYENGGKEYNFFRVLPDYDYSLAYATNSEEFCRILKN
ncbi:MAG: hypothetical protein IPM96_15755 [Ignavibacteria bacterium]|nr:hypothetical protein [Ignavibacteria bacterium]